MTNSKSNRTELLVLTADIVSAHVSNNTVNVEELHDLIKDVFSTLDGLGNQAPLVSKHQTPAVAIDKSITPDYIICLEDGKQLKMLKRHLQSQYGLSPSDYRRRWGLPFDYPMVAPNYAKHRRELAKKIGLGRSVKK